MSNYVITEGPDGTFWVSLQPLLCDVNNLIQQVEKNNPNISTITALQSVSVFIQALIHEGNTKKVLN